MVQNLLFLLLPDGMGSLEAIYRLLEDHFRNLSIMTSFNVSITLTIYHKNGQLVLTLNEISLRLNISMKWFAIEMVFLLLNILLSIFSKNEFSCPFLKVLYANIDAATLVFFSKFVVRTNKHFLNLFSKFLLCIKAFFSKSFVLNPYCLQNLYFNL